MDIVERGEATLDLAAAALHVAAEDDALVTHSAVELPVQLFVTRLQRYADEIARVYLPALGPDATPEQQLAVVRNARRTPCRKRTHTTRPASPPNPDSGCCGCWGPGVRLASQ